MRFLVFITIYILQSTCVALIGFRDQTISEERQLERAEVEVRVGKLKNGKAAGKDEITGEIINMEVTG